MPRPCPSCDGTGEVPALCGVCKGAGKLITFDDDDYERTVETCPQCGGGETVSVICPKCKGDGII